MHTANTASARAARQNTQTKILDIASIPTLTKTDPTPPILNAHLSFHHHSTALDQRYPTTPSNSPDHPRRLSRERLRDRRHPPVDGPRNQIFTKSNFHQTQPYTANTQRLPFILPPIDSS
jgi:hypothetical protein